METSERPGPVDPEDPDPPRERIAVAEDAPLDPPRPTPGHTHAGLRGLRFVLLALAAGIVLGYVVAVTTYITTDDRFTVLESYLGIRREATDNSRSELERDLRNIVCGLLADRPSDRGPEDALRTEYDCPPAAAQATQTAPAASTTTAPSTETPSSPTAPPTASTRPPSATSTPTTPEEEPPPTPPPSSTPAPTTSAPTPVPAPDPEPDPEPDNPGLLCGLLPIPILCQ